MKKVVVLLISFMSLLHGTKLVLSEDNYPNLQNSSAKQALEMFKQDYSRVDDKLFLFPETVKQFTCNVEEEELYKASSIPLAETMQNLNKEIRKTFRNSGLDSNGLKQGVSNAKVVPLEITCKGNQVEGIAELISEYDMTTEQKTASTIVHTVTRKKVMFKNGKFVNNLGPSFFQTMVTSKYTDPAVQAMMDKAKDPNPTPSVTIRYDDVPSISYVSFTVSKTPVVSAGLFGVNTTYVPSLTSMYRFPGKQDYSRMETYTNKNLVSIQHMKKEKLHGEVIIYMKNFLKGAGMRLDQMAGYENAKIVVRDGEEMIEKKSCYIDGLLTKTTECPTE